MTLQELVGWVAATLTLLTFSMQSMVALRVVAISANFAFIAYGALATLTPVLFLHLLLLPCNLLRLAQLLAGRRRTERESGRRPREPEPRESPAGARRRSVGFRPPPATRPRPGMTSILAIGAAGTMAGRPRSRIPTAEPNVLTCACTDEDCEAVLHVVRGRVCVRWGEWPVCVARAETGELLALPPRTPKGGTGAPRAGGPALFATAAGRQSLLAPRGADRTAAPAPNGSPP